MATARKILASGVGKLLHIGSKSTSTDKSACDICGSVAALLVCSESKCTSKLCKNCDKIYHKHPQRTHHKRAAYTPDKPDREKFSESGIYEDIKTPTGAESLPSDTKSSPSTDTAPLPPPRLPPRSNRQANPCEIHQNRERQNGDTKLDDVTEKTTIPPNTHIPSDHDSDMYMVPAAVSGSGSNEVHFDLVTMVQCVAKGSTEISKFIDELNQIPDTVERQAKGEIIKLTIERQINECCEQIEQSNRYSNTGDLNERLSFEMDRLEGLQIAIDKELEQLEQSNQLPIKPPKHTAPRPWHVSDQGIPNGCCLM